MRRTWGLLVVLIAAVIFAACSRTRTDAEIATEIKARMFSEQQLKAANLDVSVASGQVTLRGEVPSEAARYLAFKVVTETLGVTRIHDEMSVQAAQTASPAAPATAAATAAEAAAKPAAAPKPRKRAVAPREEAVPATAAPAPANAIPAAATVPAVPAEPPKPKEPEPLRIEIPARTNLAVRLIDGIDSDINHAGEVFAASLDAPIVVDGNVVVPAGTDVWVKLVDARSAGRMAGRSELRLELTRMEFQGKSYSLTSNTWQQQGASRGKRTAATVGGGAAIGAAIGAIAGGGKGAAIGAAIGAGAGTGVQAATKGQQIRIDSETRLDFRLEQPVEVTYFPEKHKPRRQTD